MTHQERDDHVPITDECAADWKETAGERLFSGACTNENKRKDQQNLPEFCQGAAATPWLNKFKTHTLLEWPL